MRCQKLCRWREQEEELEEKWRDGEMLSQLDEGVMGPRGPLAFQIDEVMTSPCAGKKNVPTRPPVDHQMDQTDKAKTMLS